MGLKLEVGKYYKTRDGRKVGPMIKDHGSIFHNHHQDRDLNMQVWEDDGSVYSECEGESGQTIIAEWPAEDAPTGPVRTVTRKEIVPGIYNRLGVGEQSGDCIWVGLVENDGDYDLGSLLNASQLRALAASLTEIADALEDGQ